MLSRAVSLLLQVCQHMIHRPGYKYVKIFGEPSENDGYITAGLILTEAVLAKAQEAANTAGNQFSEYVEKLIVADSQSV